MPKTNLTILNNLLNFETMTGTILTFTWHYLPGQQFRVTAECYAKKGIHAIPLTCEPLSDRAQFAKVSDPHFEERLEQECIRQYNIHLTDAALYKIDQP